MGFYNMKYVLKEIKSWSSFIMTLISFELLAGKENRAYVSEGQAAPSTRPTSSAGGKWANNYVPYDGFPQGSKEVYCFALCFFQ